MEQQLYGSSSRSREEDTRVIGTKTRSIGGFGFGDDSERRKRRSDEGTRRSKSGTERQGLRGLFFNILRSR